MKQSHEAAVLENNKKIDAERDNLNLYLRAEEENRRIEEEYKRQIEEENKRIAEENRRTEEQQRRNMENESGKAEFHFN